MNVTTLLAAELYLRGRDPFSIHTFQVPRSRPDRGSDPVTCLHFVDQLPPYLW